MNKKLKILLFAGGSVLATAILVLVLLFLYNLPYKKQLPNIPESSMMEETVLQQINEAQNRARRHPSAQNLGALGMVYHSSANYTEALQCYQLATKRNKDSWLWNYYSGHLHTELGETEKAVENYQKVIEKNRDAHLAKYYIAEEYNNQGKADLALRNYQEIVENPINKKVFGGFRNDHFPLSTYARFQYSRVVYENGKLEQAEEMLKLLIEQDELFGPAYRLLGNVYASMGEEEKGNGFTLRANDLMPFSFPVDTLIDKLVLLSRSELYLLKKIDEAEYSAYSQWALTLIEHGLKYMPENKYLISKAIKIYLWNNLDAEAAQLNDRHVQYFSDNFSELRRVGMLYYQKRMYREAIKCWSAAVRLNPDDLNVLKNLASSYWNSDEKQKAKTLLLDVLEKNRSNAETAADVAYNLYLIGEKEIATEQLSQLNKRSTNKSKVRKLAAKIAESKGDYTAAIANYEKAFKEDPTDIEIIQSLETVLLNQSMWKKYLEFYTEVLKYNPNEPAYLDKMGTFLLGCPDKSFRNLDLGLDYSKRAFTHFTSTSEQLLSSGKNLTVAYVIKQDKENALKTINQTLNIGIRHNISPTLKAELEQLYKIVQEL